MATLSNGKILRAWIYSRVSSDEQEKGTSLAYQPDECKRFADREGMVVVGDSQDVMSGLRADRPGYRRMLEAAKAREFDRVLVWRYDRLGRRESEWHRCLEELEGWGIEVWSATEPCDSLYKSIAAGLAADEVRKLSKRVLQGKQSRFKEGYWHGTAPLGYIASRSNRQGSILEPDALDDNGNVVEGSPAWLAQQLFIRFNGGESIGSLRNFLADHGIAKSKYGIRYILSSPVYTGKVRTGMYSRPRVVRAKTEFAESEGKHLPLIDQELFERVQARLASQEHLKHKGPEGTYMFRGLVYCGSCDRRYVGRNAGSNGKRKTYYVCNRKLNLNNCDSHTITATRLEAAVLGPIKTLIASVNSADARQRTKDILTEKVASQRTEADTSRTALTNLKVFLEADLEKWTDRFMKDLIPQDHYLKHRKQVEEELADVEEKLSKAPKPAAAPDMEAFFAMADILEGQPPDDQEWREIIEGMVERIVIEERDIRVVWKDAFQPLMQAASGS